MKTTYTFTAFTYNRFNVKVPCFETSGTKKECAKWWNYFLKQPYATEVAMRNESTGHIDHIIK